MNSGFKKRIVGILTTGALLIGSSSVYGADYKVDLDHSSVTFTIKHLIGKVKGSFRDFNGGIKFDKDHPEKSIITARIIASSIDTNNAKRDEHLRSKEFFDVRSPKSYKYLEYDSISVTPVSPDRYKMDGILKIRGIEKRTLFDVQFLGASMDAERKNRIGFIATTTINRKDFGIKWNKILDPEKGGGFILGDDVDIEIAVEAVEKSKL
ncbi:MAG: YceI family protein [Bdellovibrionota bacterium]